MNIHPQPLVDLYPPRRYSAEAWDYFARLAAAGSGPGPNAAAIDTLFRGLVAAGLWPKLGAACLLAGPDSLAGALVPIRSDMPAPTAFNFVAGDYSRTLGLKGGEPKYLSVISGAALSRNDSHVSTWVSEPHVGAAVGNYIGNADTITTPGAVLLGRSGVNPANIAAQLHASGINSFPSGPSTGFSGVVRADSAAQTVRGGGSETTFANASAAPLARDLWAFRLQGSTFYSTGRQAWLSAGAALDLAALDAALSAYVAALR